MFYIGLKAKINYKTAHPRHLTWESRALSSISRVGNTAIYIPGYTLIHLHANYMQVWALQHQYLRSCIFDRCIISTPKYIWAFCMQQITTNSHATNHVLLWLLIRYSLEVSLFWISSRTCHFWVKSTKMITRVNSNIFTTQNLSLKWSIRVFVSIYKII